MAEMSCKPAFERLAEYEWLLPKTNAPTMLTDGLLFASRHLLDQVIEDGTWQQIANVASLPGVIGQALAIPDMHYGYGFPIGGVAAFDGKQGLISPGGVGYDINCGVRLLTTHLDAEEVTPRLRDLLHHLFSTIPSGVGCTSSLNLSSKDLSKVLADGASWAVAQGYGQPADLAHSESKGCLLGALPEEVSKAALERGASQLGTLGSGNHFVEIQVVTELFDEQAADAFGLSGPGQVLVMFHCGSRGLGHQVCTDYLRLLLDASHRFGLSLPDKELCSAPLNSEEGRRYFGAMTAAANYAFCNRQLITEQIRHAFERVFHAAPASLGLNVLYDVAHNLARLETHQVAGAQQALCVHRKGATRAFGPGNLEVPDDYRSVGQPVLVPGDMGRASYLLCGAPGAMQKTWGSACHGAGRQLSRSAALRQLKGIDLAGQLEQQGILVLSASKKTLLEEAPVAYKDVTEVVEVTVGAGLANKVARMEPLAVIKG